MTKLKKVVANLLNSPLHAIVGTMADNGQYFSCNLIIKQEDLPDGQTLDGINPNQLLEVAKSKLASFLK